MTIAEFTRDAGAMQASIRALLELAPADKLDWSPGSNLMPLGKLLWHVGGSLPPVVVMAITKQFPPPEYLAEEVMTGRFLQSATPAEAVALLDAQTARMNELLATVTEDQWLHEQVTMPWGATGSVGQIVIQGLLHAAGHRYQLFMYLKLLGQPLGTAALFGL